MIKDCFQKRQMFQLNESGYFSDLKLVSYKKKHVAIIDTPTFRCSFVSFLSSVKESLFDLRKLGYTHYNLNVFFVTFYKKLSEVHLKC